MLVSGRSTASWSLSTHSVRRNSGAVCTLQALVAGRRLSGIGNSLELTRCVEARCAPSPGALKFDLHAKITGGRDEAQLVKEGLHYRRRRGRGGAGAGSREQGAGPGRWAQGAGSREQGAGRGAARRGASASATLHCGWRRCAAWPSLAREGGCHVAGSREQGARWDGARGGGCTHGRNVAVLLLNFESGVVPMQVKDLPWNAEGGGSLSDKAAHSLIGTQRHDVHSRAGDVARWWPW